HPEINYNGIDLKDAVLGPAKRNIERAFQEQNKKPDNVVLMAQDIERLLTVMNSNDTVERIYILFCNPWPKAKHNKRRLTYPRMLESYKQILAKGGEIHFKTDDAPLFNDSVAYFKESGFEISRITYDLHADSWPEENVLTEHEKMFMEQGIKIKALIAKLPVC
ncbi:MAG: tRNA (guanosine(46)-N7)-methyltransferase TrmB, partial [Clostridiales bacterium]|nr:tRNA (guanosine(46)-N7)-methyltransferase TrmB [Clostridiales bacterium]